MSELDAIPDPLEFALDALASRGALVDREAHVGPGETAMALLSAGEARTLGVAEEIRLSRGASEARTLGVAEELRLGRGASGEEAVSCGLGSPLLEKLVGDERKRVPVASLRLDIDRPRPAQGRAAGERFAVRNGVSEVLDVTGGEAVYLWLILSWVAEADDRNEGTLSLVIDAATGGEPDEGFAAAIDPGPGPGRSWHAPGPAGALSVPTEALLRRAAARAETRLHQRLVPTRESVARRQAREQHRLLDYFAALVAEARSPKRRVDAAALRAKVDHFTAERDAKLADLATRYALRVRLAPAALVAVTAPVQNIRLRLRRRKGERELLLRLPAGARTVDRLACDGCPGATARPILCDDRLHLLCETCAPTAEGRPRCKACRKKD